jgi:hypothetical protein
VEVVVEGPVVVVVVVVVVAIPYIFEVYLDPKGLSIWWYFFVSFIISIKRVQSLLKLCNLSSTAALVLGNGTPRFCMVPTS